MTSLIVLLGNDSSSLLALHELCRNAGYRSLRCRPLEVTDVHAVVKCAEANLVILDLWSAGHPDGWTCLGRLRADRDTAHIPTIIVTGETEAPPIEVGLLQTKHCQRITKPVNTWVLLHTIKAALGLTSERGARDNAPGGVVSGMVVTDHLLAADGGEA